MQHLSIAAVVIFILLTIPAGTELKETLSFRIPELQELAILIFVNPEQVLQYNLMELSPFSMEEQHPMELYDSATKEIQLFLITSL